MKKVFALLLVLCLTLGLAACDRETSDPSVQETTRPVNRLAPTAEQVCQKMETQLGESYRCTEDESAAELFGCFQLDETRLSSWFAQRHRTPSTDLDEIIVLKAENGYIQDAVRSLQSGFNQKFGYALANDTDLYRMKEARLLVSGNYAALLILGNPGDRNAAPDVQEKLAAEEGRRVDAAWEEIFGSAAENLLVIPEA